ncbi:HdeA/HdeB family chaperone [Mesorhizobium sp. ASY16-5R]|uniref:HdeA/HdeB family chaperone n=1 Tax=Mesorhizobium sp. ASY16-5R TaxID=3445772 RepID=UPI003FA04845
MKFLRLAPITMLAAALSAAPASSEPVDMSTISCAQLMSMKADEVSFILTWVAGYTAGTEEELSMDPDVLGKTVGDTVTYCQENAEMSVLNAIKEVSGT